MWKEISRQYLKKYKGLLALLILVIGTGTAINAVSPYVYGKLIDSIVGADLGGFKRWLIVFLIALVLTQILEAVETILGNWVVNRIENDMKENLMGEILSLRCREIDNFQGGELLNRLEFDAQTVTEYYLDLLTSILMIICNLCISVYFILRISKNLSVIAFVAFFVIYAVNIIFRKKIYGINKDIRQFEDVYYGFENDIFSNLSAVKAFQMEEKLHKTYAGYLRRKWKLLMRSACITNFATMLRGAVGNVMNVLILFFSCLSIIAGKMTIGNMVAFNSYLEKFFDAVSKIMALNLNRQSVLVSYERMKELQRQPKEEGNSEENKILSKENGQVLELTEGIKTINLQEVFFSYGNNQVLKEIDLYIPCFGLYSLVGINGSGKTTILKILERFYQADSGSVCINGNQIGDYTLFSLRHSIFYMAKEPFFLQDTILENLRFGEKDVSDEAIISACKKVEIHEDIISLPQGYNTIMGKENGCFSSGQKQKLGFARALLTKATLFLLDEVTSDLDGVAEKKICELMEKLSQRAIIINIAHKPESLVRSEKVYFLEDGRIKDSGTHQELLKQCPGYKELFVKREF